ncbi:mitochondrial Nudix hydrolase superfamily protein (8-oxo-dGTP diphosphatase) [Andalucia godoyi]|uniref:Mitochondrial Nudix hydrolase superfamily protein (8-oxo-dGTP diphosphatase) n=1 Tax=Andalucia godoyi TaxID=505711 RepID=A0A8K0AIU7_ANDGO|nr:mitochondrial Nudix hydrolase superfamily protein (8-oxo-dGTP diphosphatase) [Andalucia godoyi]|eukprot:ANDGO_05525.mRNA.1 mitochondrial Nudix hydrolase superfamily protein (8-oxo-dGTP diphosphatase)
MSPQSVASFSPRNSFMLSFSHTKSRCFRKDSQTRIQTRAEDACPQRVRKDAIPSPLSVTTSPEWYHAFPALTVDAVAIRRRPRRCSTGSLKRPRLSSSLASPSSSSPVVDVDALLEEESFCALLFHEHSDSFCSVHSEGSSAAASDCETPPLSSSPDSTSRTSTGTSKSRSGDDGDAREVLLVRRGRPPYEGFWALPGGYVEYNEDPEIAVLRELKEETGVSGCVKGLVAVMGDPSRDPVKHVVTIGYAVQVSDDADECLVPGDDALDARWIPLTDVLEGNIQLAFDHAELISQAALSKTLSFQ